MTDPPIPADIATVAARFAAELAAAGVAVGPERSERFARAVLVAQPATTRQLYWCALATLVADPADVPILARVFQATFAAAPATSSVTGPPASRRAGTRAGDRHRSAGGPAAPESTAAGDGSRDGAGYPVLASAAERLAHRDFAELTPAELAELVGLMRRLRLAPPPRRSRRTATGSRGERIDLRATLRQAGRTAGQPVRLRRRRRRQRPRRLVVLCDISGSMAPYARAMLQLLYCATGTTGGEVFTFATRLTRLTRTLRRVSPQQALERAGRAAPDWSGGTRIGAALKEFNDRYGAPGLARGAVVLIVSDGWDTGEPAQLGRQLARLRRLAHRIVWANPRTASPRYRPLVGGMAAAWPYCDAVVSAHRLAAVDELLRAIGGGSPRPGGDLSRA
ncbi:MAG TPA: VWA domain-containing protein [Natronosporangium sp.]